MMKNTFGLLVSALLGLSMFMGSAQAKTKPNPVVEAPIAFSFQVGGRTLPAGNYKFELATGLPKVGDTISVLVVRNREAGIYQALAVPVNPAMGPEDQSSVVFSDEDQHLLLAVWQNGNRLDIRPGLLEAATNPDEWSTGKQLLSIVIRNPGR